MEAQYREKLSQIDKELLNLVEKSVSVAEQTLKESKQLPPTLIGIETGGKEFMHRFVEGSMEDLKVKAQDYVKENKGSIECCVLSYDGFITTNSKKTDAIVVIAYAKSEEYGYVFAERYFKDTNETKYEDDISFIDQEVNLLKV